jgi:hypothetical protein
MSEDIYEQAARTWWQENRGLREEMMRNLSPELWKDNWLREATDFLRRHFPPKGTCGRCEKGTDQSRADNVFCHKHQNWWPCSGHCHHFQPRESKAEKVARAVVQLVADKRDEARGDCFECMGEAIQIVKKHYPEDKE